MKTTLLDITNGRKTAADNLDVSISFNGFIKHLQQRIQEEDGIKREFFEYVLSKLHADKNATGDISLDETEKHKEALYLIYNLLVPVITDEAQQLWGLSVPLKPHIFFGTNAFYDLLTNMDTGAVKCQILNNADNDMHDKMKIQLLCSLVLEKLYRFPALHKNELSYSVEDETTGLMNFFKINIDTRFVEVTAKEELPELNLFELAAEMENADFDWSNLAARLPLTSLKFSGFSIITAKDITSMQAIENIKSAIINRHPGDEGDYYKGVVSSLKTIVGSNDIEFGLLPVFKLNNKLVITRENRTHNMMVRVFGTMDQQDDFYQRTEAYLENPRVILYSNINTDNKEHKYLSYLYQNGIVSYALFPVYSGTHLAGVVEIFSKKENLLTATTLTKLEPALPLLSQLFQHHIDEFSRNIENIIKEKFTSLQPAVEWKFRDIALSYYDSNEDSGKKKTDEKIIFKEVYPLYGAVDIRNSTVERNNAQSADLIVQFKLIITTLKEIKKQVNITLADELIFKCNTWLKAIETKNINEDNLKITEFLDEEINPFLDYFKNNNPLVEPVITQYYQSVNEENGIVHHNRRVLEKSMQTINAAINQYLELFRDEVQLSYPCYFEKFRTDGIEYDIYIGQSITPQKPFNNLYLKNIRLWQLNSMVAIARITQALQPELEKKLETTQLIFIRSSAIDIAFRNDERRFDVEGSYNIRYQIIKKRIDKVHVRITGERLTQPGKIALVYFNKKEADEYLEYIKYLQSKNLLKKEVEFLELEELQGVSGLKAIRVSVVLHETTVAERKTIAALEGKLN
ncbi:CBS domain-containing protein [Ferruginibacter sp.]